MWIQSRPLQWCPHRKQHQPRRWHHGAHYWRLLSIIRHLPREWWLQLVFLHASSRALLSASSVTVALKEQCYYCAIIIPQINYYVMIILIIVTVTCYEKIDHLQFFIKTEFLAWIAIDSSMCAESKFNGASFMKKYWSQAELWPFLCSWVDTFVFQKMHIFN